MLKSNHDKYGSYNIDILFWSILNNLINMADLSSKNYEYYIYL